MIPIELHDENLEVGILIINHVLFHRHELKLTEASSFVASYLFVENRVILLFLKEHNAAPTWKSSLLFHFHAL